MKNKNLRYFVIYLSVTLFSLLVCAIYYIFSHGETDLHMTLLFLPSSVVSLLFLFLTLWGFKFNRVTYYLLNSAFSFFWFYMLLMGVYNIAFVESKWIIVFVFVSITVLLGAVINELISRFKKEPQS